MTKQKAEYGAGLLGTYNSRRAIWWNYKRGTLDALKCWCERIWLTDICAVVFRLSDGAIVYRHPERVSMNLVLTPFFIARVVVGRFVPWVKEDS